MKSPATTCPENTSSFVVDWVKFEDGPEDVTSDMIGQTDWGGVFFAIDSGVFPDLLIYVPEGDLTTFYTLKCSMAKAEIDERANYKDYVITYSNPAMPNYLDGGGYQYIDIQLRYDPTGAPIAGMFPLPEHPGWQVLLSRGTF